LPLYDYQCRACSKVTEVRHGFREAYGGTCPDCGGAMARVFNPAGIVFKGSGFYITDSRKAGGSDSASGEASTKPSETGAKPTETATKPSEPASKPSEAGPKKSESSAA
jgi:putative FmdB family regulatory protein